MGDDPLRLAGLDAEAIGEAVDAKNLKKNARKDTQACAI